MNPHNLYVGQQLWCELSERRGGDRFVTITKLGNKWATLEGHRPYRIDLETLWIDGQGYTSPGRCWLDKEARETERVTDEAWKSLLPQFGGYSANRPPHVTLTIIEQIAALLKGPE